MKKLIEFKLHAGAFPYFVYDVIGGIEIDGKRYGISKDTKDCYLPDTVKTYDSQSFIETIVSADILCRDDTNNNEFDKTRFMTQQEKIDFATKWVEERYDDSEETWKSYF